MGDKHKFPLPRYLPSLGGGFVGVGMYALEQAASQLPWWLHLPWGMMAVLAFTFGLGTLYADLMNRESKLRAWWDDVWSIGYFDEPRIYSELRDPGENHGGNQWFLRIEAPFRFRIGAASCTIGLKAVSAHWRDGRYSNRNRYSWRCCENTKFLQDDEIAIPVAFIAHDPGHHGYYGDFAIGQPRLGLSSDHVITITVEAGRRKQHKTLLLSIPYTRIATRTGGGQTNPNNRVFVSEAGREIFDPRRVESAPKLNEPVPSGESQWPFGFG